MATRLVLESCLGSPTGRLKVEGKKQRDVATKNCLSFLICPGNFWVERRTLCGVRARGNEKPVHVCEQLFSPSPMGEEKRMNLFQ